MAVKTPVQAMQERCISILFDADIVEGMLGPDLVSRISLIGNDSRSWSVLLDLVEAERVIQASPANGSRFRLSAAEKNLEFMRRFSLYKPKEKYVEGGTL